MKIHLAYGKSGLEVDLAREWDATLLEPRYELGLPDPAARVRQALRRPIAGPPLRELARPAHRVGIVFSDITRPMPHQTLMPLILEELSQVPDERITLFCGLGTHRPNTEAELRGLLGDAIYDRYRIVQNNAFDPSTQILLGQSSRGHAVYLNRALVECELKVLTGFIEPHLFAGFSGGGKAVMPGMAGLETILLNHSAPMLNDPGSTWGVTQGNPVFEEVQEIAALAGPSFLANVTLNRDREITGIFTGELRAAHERGCAFVKERAMRGVERTFDVVLTTNSGYPLDQNLYQAVKGLSAAAQIVREGGTIILAAECREGIPDHGTYGRLLRQVSSPRELLTLIERPGFLEPDQWQAQIQAQVQLKAEVLLRADGLLDSQIESALLEPCGSIEQALVDLRRGGRELSLCVLPQGPQTIPFLQR